MFRFDLFKMQYFFKNYNCRDTYIHICHSCVNCVHFFVNIFQQRNNNRPKVYYTNVILFITLHIPQDTHKQVLQ